ncbi:hypothetical protein C0J29_14490 [Mycobacterium paragordonae]|uniref:PE domain-containing protein n=1 Tax=Mycobacterium paragordonae TaxID=1389713 RepID=A0ABQ1C433_9MYCO|nr:hypothetical protein [Mycobacterium paragordonae]AYE95834.1 hypothetical protein C0J29_14490 [Mycobacterium paragordonae]GFG79129.1 hypothetical protein MPRG_24050 [Mycobacterium paragordonae]
MTDPVLEADLDALGRLKPQLQTLVWRVTQGLPHEIPAAGTVDAGAAPSLTAAQEMSTRTLPTINAAVAGRFSKLADMIDLAHQGFVASEEQLLTAVNTMPTLQRAPTTD